MLLHISYYKKRIKRNVENIKRCRNMTENMKMNYLRFRHIQNSQQLLKNVIFCNSWISIFVGNIFYFMKFFHFLLITFSLHAKNGHRSVTTNNGACRVKYVFAFMCMSMSVAYGGGDGAGCMERNFHCYCLLGGYAQQQLLINAKHSAVELLSSPSMAMWQ